ncbi:DUF1810 domain-containing protein [Candidimonas sp. SYP-B2681]|uniref:DUF1810 domain-containing protein n=1 Tax=Candidimonas sp. SYP-B2681 TaxID=2497686 RepID=UPI000F86E96D|nr:DUF1810 domain-containing protein [Candidimonas sp. SYP-B2681]RTZ44729.1 DUF1810 domain-containing protein [Candidimonas sp. SYP-B2681]
MEDPYDLERFIHAQAPVYQQICAELQQGQKRSHWMWFVFPQIAGLGHSAMAQKYALRSLEEAVAYLQHPILGARLVECTELVQAVNGRSIEQIFGLPDNLKFHSSMTLFSKASPNTQIFSSVIQKYFHGQIDAATLKILVNQAIPDHRS